jgi:hypothetical protein
LVQKEQKSPFFSLTREAGKQAISHGKEKLAQTQAMEK